MAKQKFFTERKSGMKRLFLLLPLLISLITCDKPGKIILKGEIENGKDKIIYLDRLDVEGPVVIDSTRIKNSGAFSFAFRPALPSFYRIRISDNNFITLLTEPGETITIAAEASNLPGTYNVEGSEGSALLKKLDERLSTTKKQLQPLFREIVELEEGPDLEREEARINEEVAEIIKAQRYFSVAFILDNMESLAAITALYQQIEGDYYVMNQTRDIQYLKIVAQSLMEKYPGSPHVMALAADAENQERRYELFKLLSRAEAEGEVHTTFPDISLPGLDGDTIRLRSVPEKYILLFFGSSMNQASVQLGHQLIALHRNYHGKGFQIYQVSIEREREEWIRSISFSELPWVNVATFGEGNFDAAIKYNVQQIPSIYLINKDAGVMGINMSVPELRRTLARIFD